MISEYNNDTNRVGDKIKLKLLIKKFQEINWIEKHQN
jgi:hypothetical protein